MSNTHAALSSALKRVAALEKPKQITAPRRHSYGITARQRIMKIEAGMSITIPKIMTALASTNVVVGVRHVLGMFESSEQAVLFAVTGTLRYGAVTLDEILKLKSVSRSGFFRLNETEVEHLLTAHRLIYHSNREKHEISLYQIERDDSGSGFEVEIDGGPILTLATGRKFR